MSVIRVRVRRRDWCTCHSAPGVERFSSADRGRAWSSVDYRSALTSPATPASRRRMGRTACNRGDRRAGAGPASTLPDSRIGQPKRWRSARKMPAESSRSSPLPASPPGSHLPRGSHCEPAVPGVPIGCRSPRKRGPYSTPQANIREAILSAVAWVKRPSLSLIDGSTTLLPQLARLNLASAPR